MPSRQNRNEGARGSLSQAPQGLQCIMTSERAVLESESTRAQHAAGEPSPTSLCGLLLAVADRPCEVVQVRQQVRALHGGTERLLRTRRRSRRPRPGARNPSSSSKVFLLPGKATHRRWQHPVFTSRLRSPGRRGRRQMARGRRRAGRPTCGYATAPPAPRTTFRHLGACGIDAPSNVATCASPQQAPRSATQRARRGRRTPQQQRSLDWGEHAPHAQARQVAERVAGRHGVDARVVHRHLRAARTNINPRQTSSAKRQAWQRRSGPTLSCAAG